MHPDRRRVLGAAGAGSMLGVTSLRLPSALAATSASVGIGTVADGPTVVPDDTRATVSWTEVVGATHTVEQSTDGTTWTTAAASATSPTTVEGLTNDQPYLFRIVATTETSFTGGTTTVTPRAAMRGGTESIITVADAPWRVHVFDTPGSATLQVRGVRDVEYLLVAGGGGGGGHWPSEGAYVGGGGGAGGLIHNIGGTRVTVGSDVTVTVGAGGARGANYAAGSDGGATTAPGVVATVVVGGGGGGTRDEVGRPGGSGGGAGTNRNNSRSGGSGTSGQGYGGGRNNIGQSGGGGGRAGAGGTLSAGSGLTLGITGSDVVYASGGGTPPVGTPAASGADGTGAGGDGRTSTGGGGDGGGGIVVIRYPI